MNKQRQQVVLMALSLFLVAVVGVAVVPLMSRMLSHDAMVKVSFMMMMTGFVAGVDILKPIFIRDFTKFIVTKIPIENSIKQAFIYGVGLSFLLALILTWFYGEVIGYLAALLLSMTPLAVIQSSIYYSSLESKFRVGESQLIKAVGTCVLYLFFAILSIAKVEKMVAYAAVFLSSYVVILLFLIFFTRNIVDASSGIVISHDKIRSTARFNLARVALDYLDKFLISKYAPSGAGVVYIVFSELLLRANLPIQYYTVQQFPVLCAANNDGIYQEHLKRFFGRMLILLVVIFLVMIFVSAFSREILNIYLGAGYSSNEQYVKLVAIIVLLAGCNIVVPDLLRVEGRFILLERIYYIQLTLFVVTILLSWFWVGVEGLLFSVIFLKSASLLFFIKLSFRTINLKAPWKVISAYGLTQQFAVFFVLGNTSFYFGFSLLSLLLSLTVAFLFFSELCD